MAEVERIEETVANGVRAGAAVSTISQAVEELLSNSIDAGATSVDISVDVPCYRLKVSDNGRGIPSQTLQSLIATERASSKANTVREMQHASTYGYRGEALYSLGMTSLLEIQSRCRGKDAYAKVVRGGETLHSGSSRLPLRRGTIVTLRDAFYRWPVRRKAMNASTEIARIKDLVARIAIVNNAVAITVVDSAKNKSLVKAPSTGSVTRSFARLFSSDKLSMARKLTFAFKQFRLSGYLSPPSSTACHWSKEFQLVYVNRRSVRRLDFVQKTVNAAFAPCLALLAGRGGPDGQAVVRRTRDPNSSSGQRQELFPVFLLNLECPAAEVDILSEPDKTWVEFADWPNAKNAVIAMLLAFLPHFSHAVPGNVLRDLRRTFHRADPEEMWKVASPPRAPQRALQEPALTPSPSPIRLGAPDIGSPSPRRCRRHWMGGDGGVGEVGSGEPGVTMAFQEGHLRAEGVLYPSPATRFGARCSDSNALPSCTSLRAAEVGGGGSGAESGIGGTDMSRHFAGSFPEEKTDLPNCDVDREWETRGQAESPRTFRSPYFEDHDGRRFNSLGDRENDRLPRRRLAMERISSSRWQRRYGLGDNPLDFSTEDDYGANKIHTQHAIAAAADSDAACHGAPSDVSAADFREVTKTWTASGGGDAASGIPTDTEPGGDEADRVCDGALAMDVDGLTDYSAGDAGPASEMYTLYVSGAGGGGRGRGGGGGSVADPRAFNFEGGSLSPPRPLPHEGLNFGSIYGRPRSAGLGGRADRRAGGGCRRRRRDGMSYSKGTLGHAPRRKGEWLRRLPGIADEGRVANRHEARKGTEVEEGVDARCLSRLFTYAFPVGNRSESLDRPNVGKDTCEDGEDTDRVGDGSLGAVQHSLGRRVTDRSRADSGERYGRISSSSLSRSFSRPLLLLLPVERCGGTNDSSDANKQSVLGVTVRRPPSPQFDFCRGEEERSLRGSSVSPNRQERDRSRQGDVAVELSERREKSGSSPPWAVADRVCREEDAVVAREKNVVVSVSSPPTDVCPERVHSCNPPSSSVSDTSRAYHPSDVYGEYRRRDNLSPLSAPARSKTLRCSVEETGVETAKRGTPPSPYGRGKRKRATQSEKTVDDVSTAWSSSTPSLRPPEGGRQGRAGISAPAVRTAHTFNSFGVGKSPAPSHRGDHVPEEGIALQDGNDVRAGDTMPEDDGLSGRRGGECAVGEEEAELSWGGDWLGWSRGSRRSRHGWWAAEPLNGNGGVTHGLAAEALEETLGDRGGSGHDVAVMEPRTVGEIRFLTGRSNGGEEIHQGREIDAERDKRGASSGRAVDAHRELDGDRNDTNFPSLSDKRVAGVDHRVHQHDLPVDKGERRGSREQEDPQGDSIPSYGNEEGRWPDKSVVQPQEPGNVVLEEAEGLPEVDALLPKASCARGVARGGDTWSNGKSRGDVRVTTGVRSGKNASVGKSRGETLIRTAMDNMRATDVALAYDLDVLGGDGLGSYGASDAAAVVAAADADGVLVGRDPSEISGAILESLLPAEACDSCQVSDPGGAAVNSPRGPGGGRARRFGDETERMMTRGFSDKRSAREKPIAEVTQTGQDEVGAGAGAVPVTVTPGELGRACVIGQAGRKFILLRAETGAILCVDQHAADERIKLEALQRQVFGENKEKRNIDTLVLQPPETLPITASDGQLLELQRKVLSSWCFEFRISHDGGDRRGAGAPVATLLSVPVVCGVRLSVQDLLGFLHHLRESVLPGASATWLRPPQVQHILNYKACHSAIRFGDMLSRPQCIDLIRKLSSCERPFCCAHGRPSVVPLCVMGGAAPPNSHVKLFGNIVGEGKARHMAGRKNGRPQYHKIRRRL